MNFLRLSPVQYWWVVASVAEIALGLPISSSLTTVDASPILIPNILIILLNGKKYNTIGHQPNLKIKSRLGPHFRQLSSTVVSAAVGGGLGGGLGGAVGGGVGYFIAGPIGGGVGGALGGGIGGAIGGGFGGGQGGAIGGATGGAIGGGIGGFIAGPVGGGLGGLLGGGIGAGLGAYYINNNNTLMAFPNDRMIILITREEDVQELFEEDKFGIEARYY